ncbi:hypothetical protein N9L76_03975, partial [bacterium]|nr:hypothetical protein [bacterium]
THLASNQREYSGGHGGCNQHRIVQTTTEKGHARAIYDHTSGAGTQNLHRASSDVIDKQA